MLVKLKHRPILYANFFHRKSGEPCFPQCNDQDSIISRRNLNSDGEYDDTYNETPGQTQIGRKHRAKDFLFKPKEKLVKASFQILIGPLLNSDWPILLGYLVIWKPIKEHLWIASEKEKSKIWETSGSKAIDCNK